MKCSRCKNREGAVTLSYGGDVLCETCFGRLFEKRVRKTIRVNKLLSRGDNIAVGLSGGKDSATALYVLEKLTRQFPDSTLYGVTIDMGVKGLSRNAVVTAGRLCERLEVEHTVFTLKDELGVGLDEVLRRARGAGSDKSACTWCGVLRRRALNRRLREMGVTKFVTGHNLDDEIQTFWMNVMRSDYGRIARMGAYVGLVKARKFVPRIKPLRDTPEDEISSFARIHDIPHTKLICPLRGDSMRVTVKGVLDGLEKKHPGSKFQTMRSVDKLMDLMRKQYAGAGKIGVCGRCGEYASGRVCKACQLLEEIGLN